MSTSLSSETRYRGGGLKSIFQYLPIKGDAPVDPTQTMHRNALPALAGVGLSSAAG